MNTNNNSKLPTINQSNQNLNDQTQSNKNKNTQQNKSKLSVSNVNDILHLISDKQGQPSANVNLVKQLREEIDHERIKKNIEKIPNRPPNMYDQQAAPHKTKYCMTDVQYDGNYAEVSQLMNRAPGYTPKAPNASFLANLRNYGDDPSSTKNKQTYIPIKQRYRYDTIDNSQSMNYNSNTKNNQSTINKSSVRNLEKNWYNFSKVDRKEYSSFSISKSNNLKDSLNHSIMFQDQGYQPSYLALPKYSEKFQKKNLIVTYGKDIKKTRNSDIHFMSSLRSY